MFLWKVCPGVNSRVLMDEHNKTEEDEIRHPCVSISEVSEFSRDYQNDYCHLRCF